MRAREEEEEEEEEEKKKEDFSMKTHLQRQERRRRAPGGSRTAAELSSTWNRYWSTFVLVGFIGGASAYTPEDCQEIDPNTFPNPEISFDESLSFTVLANQKDSWNFSATISDLNGVSCSFGVWRQPDHRSEYFLCPGTNHNHRQNISEKQYHQNISEKTEVSFDAERRQSCFLLPGEGFTTSCGRDVRITLPQLFGVGGYKPKWIQTLLEPPLRMTVDKISNANLTINCKHIDCLQTSGALAGNMAHKRYVFFLKPADSFEGVEIKITASESCYVDVNRNSLQVKHGSWFNITLEYNGDAVKVLVDGRESARVLCLRSDFWIKSVHLKGGGLLTWCDPRDIRQALDLKMITIFALLGVIAAMFAIMIVIIICCAKRRPSPTIQGEVGPTPSAPQDDTNHQGKQRESAVYDYVETGTFVNALMTRHDSENSLYQESKF
ncbi:uncharacterized protein LOC135221240 [Macrobrachium nipponense]|uniref:uncharacterized protein LOC135221240 n=1 Tax=Macrobrachium nipponense TaxID=159736 RepID=UPI0030C7F3CE